MKKRLIILSLIFISFITVIATPTVVSAEKGKTGAELKEEYVGELTCGGTAEEGRGIKFHETLPTFTSRLYDILKIATPVIVIFTGMLDILKAVTAQKEDDMKKAQKKFVNRLIAGAVVFLVFMIVEVVVNLLAGAIDVSNAINCVDCFLNGPSNCR